MFDLLTLTGLFNFRVLIYGSALILYWQRGLKPEWQFLIQSIMCEIRQIHEGHKICRVSQQAAEQESVLNPNQFLTRAFFVACVKWSITFCRLFFFLNECRTRRTVLKNKFLPPEASKYTCWWYTVHHWAKARLFGVLPSAFLSRRNSLMTPGVTITKWKGWLGIWLLTKWW